MGTLDPLKTTNDKFYYTLSILMSLDVQRSLFVLYLLQLGITQGEIGVLQSFLFFSSVALEIPSGLLADRYGRKYSLALSFLGLFISGIGFLLFSDFIPFVIIFAYSAPVLPWVPVRIGRCCMTTYWLKIVQMSTRK